MRPITVYSFANILMNFFLHFSLISLQILHLIILSFVMFAWIFPVPFIWKIHIIFIPLMILQWQLNQGTCILTNLDNYLRGEAQVKQQQQGKFIKMLLGKCLNSIPEDNVIKGFIYGIIGVSWMISITRLGINGYSMY